MYAYSRKRTVPLWLSPRALKRPSHHFPSLLFSPVVSIDCFLINWQTQHTIIKYTQKREDNGIKLDIYKMYEIRHAGRDNISTISDIQDHRLEYGKYNRRYRIEIDSNEMTKYDMS
jgi:hypothetical protein